MVIQISLADQAINFNPSSEVDEIIQNVRTILLTSKYSVPLNRGFGVAGDWIDMPIHQAAAYYQRSIIQAISESEPRAEVVSVGFDGSQPLDGILKPTVTVKLRLSYD